MTLENQTGATGGGMSALDRARLLKEEKLKEKKEAEDRARAEEEEKNQQVLGTLNEIDEKISELDNKKQELETKLKEVETSFEKTMDDAREATSLLQTAEDGVVVGIEQEGADKVFGPSSETLNELDNQKKELENQIKQTEEQIESLGLQKNEFYAQTPEGVEEKKREEEEVIKQEIRENYSIRPVTFVEEKPGTLNFEKLEIQNQYSENITQLVDQYGEETAKIMLTEIHGEPVKEYFEKQKAGPQEALRQIQENPAYSPEAIQDAKEKYNELLAVESEMNNLLQEKGIEKISLENIGLRFQTRDDAESSEYLRRILNNKDEPDGYVDYRKLKDGLEKCVDLARELYQKLSRLSDQDLKNTISNIYSKDVSNIALEIRTSRILIGLKCPEYKLKNGQTVDLRPNEWTNNKLQEEISELEASEQDAQKIIELQVDRNIDEQITLREANQESLPTNLGKNIEDRVNSFEKSCSNAKYAKEDLIRAEIKFGENLDKKIAIDKGRIIYDGVPQMLSEKKIGNERLIKEIESRLQEATLEYEKEKDKEPFFGKEKHAAKVEALRESINSDKNTIHSLRNELIRIEGNTEIGPEIEEVLNDVYNDGSGHKFTEGIKAFEAEYGNRLKQGMTLREALKLLQETADQRSSKKLPERIATFSKRKESRNKEKDEILKKHRKSEW